MHISDLRLFFSRNCPASNAAGHSDGGSSPSRTHAYVHADKPMHVVESAQVPLHLIHGHDPITIRQEHDISAASSALAP
jgi:hypothetical protein